MTDEDLIETARRAKGSAVLPTVSFGVINAEALILRMADRIEELEAELQAVTEALEAENKRLKEQCEGLAQAAMNNGQGLLIAEAKLATAVQHIEWFISEDETNRGDEPMPERRGKTWNEINAYWIEHLDSAIAFVAELKGEKT